VRLKGLARHELPALDEAALLVARDVEVLIDAADGAGVARWAAFLAPFPDLLRDAPPADLRTVARRVRAAFGAKDSIADVLPWVPCMTLRDDLDALLRVLSRAEATAD
jgi:hypothetical protein